MANEGILTLIPAMEAGADLTAEANQYRFVKLDGSGRVVLCAAVTDKPIGVLLNRPQLGEAARVACAGMVPLRGSEALTIGASVGTSADGRAQIVTVVTEATVYLAGTVLKPSGAADGIATALINCMNPARAA